MNKIEKIEKITREQIAVELHYNGFDAHGNRIESNTLDVRFKDIRNADVGDTFIPKMGNLQNYDIEVAEVIMKDENNALIKVCYIEDIDYNIFEESNMFHIVLD